MRECDTKDTHTYPLRQKVYEQNYIDTQRQRRGRKRSSCPHKTLGSSAHLSCSINRAACPLSLSPSQQFESSTLKSQLGCETDHHVRGVCKRMDP